MGKIRLQECDRRAVRNLLDWFAVHARALPWRQERSPWRTWVSEVMLQQTRVETVIPYFHRFMDRFPDPASLAQADEDELFALWQGLGYYRRARHLQAAARRVLAEEGGQIPRDPERFRSLPGVGDYMAAAVLSISWAWPRPALDGNLLRVGARWFARLGALQSGAVRRPLDEAFRRIIPRSCPGDFNEALMDLGSSLCLPRRPRCFSCPLAPSCRARRRGLLERIPPAPPARVLPGEVRAVFLLADSAGRICFRRRPAGGIWEGLWELPQEKLDEGREESVGEALGRLGVRAGPLCRGMSFWHAFSHCRWRLDCWRGSLMGELPASWRLAGPADWAQLALPAPMRRILTAEMGEGGGNCESFSG